MPRQHQYTDVQVQDHHDDDSSTEVESLVGGEKSWATNGYTRPSRSRRETLWTPCLSALRWFIVIALQIVIVGLLAREQGLLMDSKWTRAATTSEKEVGGDMTGWGPHSTHPPLHTLTSPTNPFQSRPKSRHSRSTKPSRHTTPPTSSSPRPSKPGTT